jgi:CHAT domain-containing protein/Tfp pilus assembly protein PilF
MNVSRALTAWFLLPVAIGSGCSALCAQQWRVQGLNSRVAALVHEGKYADATPIAIEAVQVADATWWGPDQTTFVVALSNLADLYEAQGKYPDAEPLYQRSLGILEKELGPDNAGVARGLNDLARLYSEEGRYAEAEPLFERGITILESKPGVDDFDLVTAFNNLAVLFLHQGKYAEAEPLLQRTLAIREKEQGPDNPDVAQALNNLAMLYREQGKYAEAEPLLQRSLAIRERAQGPDNPDVAEALNNLSVLFVDQGKYAEAEPLLQHALAIQEKALGPDHPDVAKTLNNLANSYSDEGKYAEAEPLLQRSLAIREKALGPDHPDVATALNNLSEVYRAQGRYAEAEPLLRRSLAIREKVLGPDHPLVAATLDNLAQLYVSQGKYADAEPLYGRDVAIREKALGPNHPDLAVALDNLAVLYLTEGKSADAEPILRRALAIQEKALGPDHPGTAKILNNLAEVCNRERNYPEAETLLKRSLAIYEKEFGESHIDVAEALNNLATLYQLQGEYAEAEPLLQRSLAIRETVLGPDHAYVGESLSALADLYDARGKYAEAQPFYRRGLDNIFQQFRYNFTYMTEKDRLAFLNTVSLRFPDYLSFVYRYRQQDPGLIGSMYDLLLWEKGFVAASIAGMRRQIEASGDKQVIDLLNQLSAKRTQIAALLTVNPPYRDAWRKQIDQLRAEADEIEKALVARSAAFAEKQKLERATWQQVRDALGPDEAAVEFARFPYYDKKWTGTSYYVALVVTRETKNEPEYIILGEGKTIEGDAFTRFQHATQPRGFDTVEDGTLPGGQAYSLIWQPLESVLSGIKRIYISPDGALNETPFGLIPSPDGKLLMERYDLRLLSSTKDVLRAAPPPTAATALLVGNPTFDLSEDQQRAALEKLTLPQPPANLQLAALSPNDVSRDATGSSSQLPPLPGTGTEVNVIAGLMQSHGWETRVYLQDTALKRVVEQASGPRVVHVATHGFFLPDQQVKLNQTGASQMDQPSGLEDPMLRSGLYFAAADRTLANKPTPEGLDNGVLTAMEASGLNLSGTELVVLSACNTGRGDVENGEGVFGLRRALQEAGAQAVLMSLWSVPDKETQELMRLFYSKWLSGTEIHEALKEAQLEMREKVKREHDGRDLPYYWGAFVLVGR